MFTNATDLLADNPVQLNYGVAVTDHDGDGSFEAVVAGFGFPNLVLKWDGEKFIDIAGPTVADRDRRAIGVAACDVDGDGYEELYVLNTDTFSGEKQFSDRLFDRVGDDFTDLFSLEQNAAVLNQIAGRSVACVDRFGTGTYAVMVANYGGPMKLYEMNEDGQLTDVAPAAGVNLVTGGRGLVSLPLVTTRMDIFAGNERGANFLFRNNGDGTFTDVAMEVGIPDAAQNVRGIAPLDLNRDGVLDLAYGNWEGPHRLVVNNGLQPWADIAPPALAAPTRIRTVVAADFDNDGKEELFFNNIGQPNKLFGYRDRDWVQLDIGDALEPSGLGTGAAVGDFDGDGRLELIVSHGESGAQQLSLYHTPKNDNHYLRVLPLTQHGAPARGAVVTIQTANGGQIRAIDAGSGYLCQMEPVAHFGLGDLTTIEQVTVRWPDGTTATMTDMMADQMIRIAYPS
jgi:hypothetical protein